MTGSIVVLDRLYAEGDIPITWLCQPHSCASHMILRHTQILPCPAKPADWRVPYNDVTHLGNMGMHALMPGQTHADISSVLLTRQQLQ